MLDGSVSIPRRSSESTLDNQRSSSAAMDAIYCSMSDCGSRYSKICILHGTAAAVTDSAVRLQPHCAKLNNRHKSLGYESYRHLRLLRI